jgi:uncharacterized protein YqjF (DUF2071 family)
MNSTMGLEEATSTPSEAGRSRLLTVRGEPLFIADWETPLMIHYEVDARELQRVVPFKVDLWEGRAFVTVVAFTLRGMRLRFGGSIGRWLLKPIATHPFLNVRTYVRSNDEAGIYFLTEWLPNPLSVLLGPRLFGLPYKLGTLDYHHEWRGGRVHGRVTDKAAAFAYSAEWPQACSFEECPRGSLCEWLMERYAAFTCFGEKARFFRVWHPPWLQREVDVCVSDDSLLRGRWKFFNNAACVGANFSPGLKDVWMGRVQRV